MRRTIFSMSALLAILVFTAAAAGSSAGGPRSTVSLDLYTGVVSSATLGRLVRQGYDIADARPAAGGVRVDLVLTQAEVAKLGAQGVDVQPRRDAQGHTQAQRAAAQAAGGFNVWRSYDAPGGIRDELYSIARRNSQIVKLEVIGHTLQGREIIALKVTKNAKTVADGTRPDVLYMSTIHAREWISTEVNRRLLHYFVDNYGKNADVTNLVNTSELWFLVVANPDGYQYTFDHAAAVAEEPPRQRRRRADHRERRRRPEPQLQRRLGLRQRGLVDAVLRRRLPRHRAGVRARDTGAPGADRPAQVQVPDHVPLVRPADPLSVRVAGADAVGGRPAVRRVLGDRRDPGDQRLRPGRGRRPLHHERHHRRLLVREDRRAVVDGRAERGLRRLRVRVPRRRVARAGRVREEPAVRARPREVGGEPGAAGLAPGQHGQALLPRHGQGRDGPGRA